VNSKRASDDLAQQFGRHPGAHLAGAFWEEMVKGSVALRDLGEALHAPCPACGKLPVLHLTGDPPSVRLECECLQHVVDGGKVFRGTETRDAIAGVARIWLRDHRGQP
jgi:hypothetical protein